MDLALTLYLLDNGPPRGLGSRMSTSETLVSLPEQGRQEQLVTLAVWL